MSTSTWIDRAKNRGSSARTNHRDGPQRRIGFDLPGRNDPRRAKALVSLVLVALLTALGIAALRIDLIRTRYAVAAATASENGLIEEQRALIARKRKLRDPIALAIEARERGFRPAAHVFSLPDPKANMGTPPRVASRPRKGRGQ